MYPERFYGQGGNPLFTSTNIVEHQIDDMQDEIMISKEHYDVKDFLFGGVIVDKEKLIGKPDLIGWVNIKLTSDELKKIFYSRDPTKRPNDAWDIAFVPRTKEGLLNCLTKETKASQYCPPCQGGLILYGRFNFGDKLVKEVINNL